MVEQKTDDLGLVKSHRIQERRHAQSVPSIHVSASYNEPYHFSQHAGANSGMQCIARRERGDREGRRLLLGTCTACQGQIPEVGQRSPRFGVARDVNRVAAYGAPGGMAVDGHSIQCASTPAAWSSNLTFELPASGESIPAESNITLMPASLP